MPLSPALTTALTRRRAVAWLAACPLAAITATAAAQPGNTPVSPISPTTGPAPTGAYPTQPITLLVPQNAGGANDIIARVLAHSLSQQMGVPVVVENRAGAGGTLATAGFVRARADGHALLLTTDSAHVIGPALYRNPGFDPVRDFTPIAPVATAGYVLVAHPGLAANDVAALIDLARARPGELAIATAGNGTLNHLISVLLQKAAGIELLHVPYKGSAAAAADVAGGQVPLSVQSLPSVMGLVRTGKLKVLGVVNPRRVAALPSVPTLGETLPGFGQSPWYAVFGPASMPAAVVQRLQAEIHQALRKPEVLDKLAAAGCEPFDGPAHTLSTQLAALVQADVPKWARTVQEAGATLD